MSGVTRLGDAAFAAALRRTDKLRSALAKLAGARETLTLAKDTIDEALTEVGEAEEVLDALASETEAAI